MDGIAQNISVLPDFSINNMMQHPEILDEGGDESFYICEIGKVVNQHKQWMQIFPRIRPHYAVKCNPDEVILNLMIAMGMGFDCASKSEIKLVLSLGAKAEDIIYANPCKQISHLLYSADENVKRNVFDSKEELDKIKEFYPDSEIVLRIKTNDSSAQCPLSQKYGADVEDSPNLIDYARKLDLNVIGISFHVGSGCKDCSTFVESLNDARELFDYARQVGYHFTLLDIGGGFPGSDNALVSFDEIGLVVNEELEKLFPVEDYPDLEVIAEPGRYYVTSAYTLVTSVIGKRIVNESCQLEDEKSLKSAAIYNYIVNEGVFGGFNLVFYDHAEISPTIYNADDKNKYYSNIWGPARTNLDKLMSCVLLPELEVDDKILWKDMGAYSMSSKSSFNSVVRTPIKYVISQDAICGILKLSSLSRTKPQS